MRSDLLPLDSSFQAFWSKYPLKVGRLATIKVWTKLNPDDALVDKILRSIEDHQRGRAWREGFICHPVTFLRQGRWLDEVPVEPIRITEAERRHAEQARRAAGGCTHAPRCATYAACLELLVLQVRGQA